MQTDKDELSKEKLQVLNTSDEEIQQSRYEKEVVENEKLILTKAKEELDTKYTEVSNEVIVFNYCLFLFIAYYS